jgi:hypothetical protein
MTGSDKNDRHTAGMDLIELARTIQQDRDRTIQQRVRLRRLLPVRADLPGPTRATGGEPALDRTVAQVAARPGSPR